MSSPSFLALTQDSISLSLSLASAGVQKKWGMKKEYSSKIDTADFYSLPKIKAI